MVVGLDIERTTMVLPSSPGGTVIAGGNCQFPFTEGHYERRVFRSPSRDPSAPHKAIRLADRSRAASLDLVVSRVVEPLTRIWPRRAVGWARLVRWVSTTIYPTRTARASNDLHQVDFVSPNYLCCNDAIRGRSVETSIAALVRRPQYPACASTPRRSDSRPLPAVPQAASVAGTVCHPD